MRKILLITAFCISNYALFAQESYIRQPSIGVSFIMNDFVTPSRIRSTSLAHVFNSKQWAKFTEIGTGLAINYFQGLKEHIDFSASVAGSFVKNVLPNENASDNSFLLEADAAANFKLFTDAYWFTPYVSAGLGIGIYKAHFSAIVPVGLGVKLNLFDEAAIFISSQYRIPVTTETSSYHLMHSIGIAGIIGQKKSGSSKDTQ
jgi:OOP family OmpA-OmpF porin